MARTKQIAKRSFSKRNSGSEARESKRSHTHKSGTQALLRIRRLVKCGNLLIPAPPFIRTVRKISNYFAPQVTRWQAEALRTLQEALEDHLVGLFEDSMLCLITAKHVAIGATSDDPLS